LCLCVLLSFTIFIMGDRDKNVFYNTLSARTPQNHHRLIHAVKLQPRLLLQNLGNSGLQTALRIGPSRLSYWRHRRPSRSLCYKQERVRIGPDRIGLQKIEREKRKTCIDLKFLRWICQSCRFYLQISYSCRIDLEIIYLGCFLHTTPAVFWIINLDLMYIYCIYFNLMYNLKFNGCWLFLALFSKLNSRIY